MDVQEVGGVCGNWMELAQDRDIWRAHEYGKELSGSKILWGILDKLGRPVSFSRRTVLDGVSKSWRFIK
jgi:hypothetical protein